MLAINPGQVFGALEGIPTKDPTFGLDALWINSTQRDYAQSVGYTVVDPSTVIATHLSQIIQDNSAELLGHEEVQQMIERLIKQAPKLAEAITPAAGLTLSVIVRVLQKLLTAGIPITDFRTIAENFTVAHINKTQDIAQLTETGAYRITPG